MNDKMIEELSLNNWQPLSTLLYDGWVLRFSNGYTKRANSINPIHYSTYDLKQKITECEKIYSKNDLPTTYKITPFVKPENLDDILEQNASPPQSLQMKDSKLTEVGECQANKLKETFPVSSNDLFIISPLRRTIQTALIWTSDVHCQRIVHPLIGPRMFPLLSPDKAYGCDQTLSKKVIEEEFPQLEIANEVVHWNRGINTISANEFNNLAKQFIDWCRGFNKDKIFIVSHDGTITSYRQYLGESVTREHFLGDTGWYKAII